VKKEEGIELAENKEIDFVEISAKSGENITDLFTEISKTLCQDFIPEDKID
jgi:translation initiation factor IF-2